MLFADDADIHWCVRWVLDQHSLTGLVGISLSSRFPFNVEIRSNGTNIIGYW